MPTIIFDLSDVIIRGLKGAESSMSSVLDLSPAVIHRQYHEPELTDLFLGRISEDTFWDSIIRRHSWNTDRQTLKRLARDNMTEIDGMLPLLAELRDRGTTLGLISNHAAEWVEDVERRYPLAELFHDRVYSYDVRLAKPNPLIYQRAAQRLHQFPSDILFIDDHHPNLLAAAGTRMRTMQFHTPHQLRTALRVEGYI